MEAVCYGKNWDVALAYKKEGEIVGALPYLIGKRWGMRYIVQPQLTQYNGPWYRFPDGVNERKRIQFQYDVDKQLIEHLKKLKLAFFSQNFGPHAKNHLAYHWEGFCQTTRYSYRLEDISNPMDLLDGMSPKNRRYKIENLMPTVDVVSDITPEELARMQNACLEQQGKRNVMANDFVVRVASTAIERGNGVIVGLKKRDNGQILGMGFAVYDRECAYALITAYPKNSDSQSINTCLFWALIKELSPRTKAFDFEGSMDQGIEYFFRSFGASQSPYHHIWRCNNPIVKPIIEPMIRQ